MATCKVTINEVLNTTGLDSITPIEPSTPTLYSTSAGVSQLFLIQSATFQTIQFQVSSTSLPTNVAFTFYRYLDGSISNIGSANLTASSSQITLDIMSGDYILCIRGATSAQAGSFTAQFTAYTISPLIRPYFYAGESIAAIVSTPAISVDCNRPIYFALTDGELPPGITLSGQGILFGQLPNMDCLEDRTNYSPGMNWSFTDKEGYAQPQGRQWRFKVKAWIEGFEETAIDENWFCIRVHNNWTLDQEKFIAQAPFETVKEVVVTKTTDPLPETVCVPCEKDEDDVFVPVSIDRSALCGPCADSPAERVELIEIPSQISSIDVNDIITQYEVNRFNPSNSPEVNKFIEALTSSNNFQILRAKAGLATQEVLDEIEREYVYISVERYLNYIQIAQTRLDPDEDTTSLQYQIREWNIYQNRILPIQIPLFVGEFMTCEITGDFRVTR